MSKSGFAPCDHLFNFGCSGEVVNLIKVAERYGILLDKAKARIEAVCRLCSHFPRQGKNCMNKEQN